MEGTPLRSTPYRTNARVPEGPRQSRRRRWRTSVARLLGAPRLAGLVLAGVVAVTFGNVNASAGGRGGALQPGVERAENLAALGLLLTIPLVSLLLLFVWQRLPAAKATKRKHVVRSTAIQTVAVLVGVLSTVVLRPSSARVVASAAGPHGQVGYAYRWDWGCGYRIGVSDGPYAVRPIAAVAPFPCDAPPARIGWHGTNVALIAADGTEIGSWSTDP